MKMCFFLTRQYIFSAVDLWVEFLISLNSRIDSIQMCQIKFIIFSMQHVHFRADASYQCIDALADFAQMIVDECVRVIDQHCLAVGQSSIDVNSLKNALRFHFETPSPYCVATKLASDERNA